MDLLTRVSSRESGINDQQQKRQKEKDKDLLYAEAIFAGGDPRLKLEGKTNAHKVRKDQIFKATPEEIFVQADLDESGFIDFEEFKTLLPKLGFNMADAKASRYFKTLDTDGSGELDFDEFKAVLYACDPNSGNSIGFTPTNELSPKDAFKMFDGDNSGRIDEDEFAEVLEYLGIQLKERKQEAMFKKFDKDKSGYIDYNEFRKIWIHLSDIRGELLKRGYHFSRSTPKAVLLKRLEQILEHEEQLEEQSLAQAKAWRDWKRDQHTKEKHIIKAKKRANDELLNALDIAGQVYVFGVGAHGQFSADAARPHLAFKQFDQIRNLWKARVAPDGPAKLKLRNIGQVATAYKKRTKYPLKFGMDEGHQSDKTSGEIGYDAETDQPGRDEDALFPNTESDDEQEDFKFSFKSKSTLEKLIRGSEFGIPDASEADSEYASDDSENQGQETQSSTQLPSQNSSGVPSIKSAFTNVVCPSNTAALWGRRVVQVSTGMSTAFAMTDAGQVLAWGGRDRWWNEVDDVKNKGFMTDRSMLMLDMKGKTEWEDVLEPPLDLNETEDEKYERYKFVTKQYYEIFEECPYHGWKTKHMENVILPKLTFQEVLLTATIRGIPTEGLNKMQMIDTVYDALRIEQDKCGPQLSKQIRQAELDIQQMQKDKNSSTKLQVLQSTVPLIWEPMKNILKTYRQDRMEQMQDMKQKRIVMHEAVYRKWRATISKPVSITRIGALTERGEGPQTYPEDSNGFKFLSSGAFHVSAIHSIGSTLYSWGDGNFGRLGQGQGPGMTRHNASQEVSNSIVAAVAAAGRASVASASRFDCSKPQVISDLQAQEIAQVSSGFSHNLAVTSKGKVYGWGGGDTGKLGLGAVTEEYECYCPYPVRIRFQDKVKQVSCGNSHSAAVTVNGDLYMWGCGDSFRLGLGKETDTRHTPTLVKTLQVAGVKISEVSCGCTHTAAITTIRSSDGTRKTPSGGHVYIAGPSTVLGRDRPKFHLVKELFEIPVVQLSCGYGTTACVSAQGEMFSWGSNKGGALGHPVHRKMYRSPHLVKCLYQIPRNLALGRKTKQSSVFNKRTSEIAVNGDTCGDGESFCIHTQVDAQPYWEVDLGRICVIEKVDVWNREDKPSDESMASDTLTKRLFPCWLMVSATPFDRELVNAHSQAAAKKKATKNRRRTSWDLPPSTTARYIRVQLEGTSFLHVAEVQVFGTPGVQKPVGKISSVCCGKEVTVAIVNPTKEQSVIDNAYKKAVKADAANAVILRQYPTYFSSWDKFGYGDNIEGCPLDRGPIKCEICILKSSWPDVVFPPGPVLKLRRLESMGNILLDTTPKPENWEIIKQATEGMVDGVMQITDAIKNVFKKGATEKAMKLLSIQVAKDRFGISLSGTSNQLLEQYQNLKNGVELETPAEIQIKETLPALNPSNSNSPLISNSPLNSSIASNAVSKSCAACSECDNFEPLIFNPRICKVCTHLKTAHVGGPRDHNTIVELEESKVSKKSYVRRLSARISSKESSS